MRPALAPLLLLAACGGQGVPCDLARDRPATASSSADGGTPALAFDGDDATAWQSADSTGAWVQVDLGQQKEIAGARVLWGWDTATADNAESRLEVSLDGGGWTPAVTSTLTLPLRLQPQFLSFAPAQARYVRLLATRWGGGAGQVNTLEVLRTGCQ